MKRKYSVAAAIVLILCLLLLAACTAEAPPADPAVSEEAIQQVQPQETPEASEAPAPSEKPVAASETAPVPEPEPTGEATQSAPEPAYAEKEDTVSIQLEGTGINNPLSLSLDELKAMKDQVVEDDFFSLNSYGTKEYFHFKGVRLAAVLQKAGLKKEAATVTVAASDGYKLELSVEQALKEDYIDEQDPAKKYPVIIAWQENGSDYDTAAGYPFRLVIGQKEAGDVNKPQWVMNIAKISVN